MSDTRSESYVRLVWRQYRRNWQAMISLYGILTLAFVAVFADFIANEKPYVVQVQGRTYAPILVDYAVSAGLMTMPAALRDLDYRHLEDVHAWFPPIPYSPSRADLSEEAFAPPSARHWFGTDQLGRDVASGMVHGSRISLTVGLVVVAIQLTIGMLLGGLAGAVILVAAYFIGVALLGAGLGALVAHVSWNYFGAGDPPPALVIVLAIVGAIGAMFLQRYVIIVATAFGGAYTLIVGGLAMSSSGGGPAPTVRSADVWILYPTIAAGDQRWLPVAWVLLGVCGTAVQMGLTARKRA